MVSVISSSSDTLAQSKLNSQLTGAMEVMTNDIRRAGYWGTTDPAVFADPTSNPFSQWDSTALEVHNNNAQVASDSAAGGDCIVYSYDADNDGVLDNEDIVGFRLNNGVIQMRVNGDIANNARHDACNDGDDNWQNLTNANLVSVTNLNFALDSSVCINNREPDGVGNDDATEIDCYTTAPVSGDITTETRSVNIAVTGQLVNDNLTQMTFNQEVRVRNDLVRLQP